MPKPLSRYSSSDSVLRLDSGSNHSGSVAEKAMMFELTANLQNQNSPNKTNGSRSPVPSPKMSPRKKRTAAKQETPKENNENTQNVANGADNKTNSNVQDMFHDIANRSWADIMDAESDNFT